MININSHWFDSSKEIDQIKKEKEAFKKTLLMLLQASNDFCIESKNRIECKDIVSLQSNLDQFHQWVAYLATSPLIKEENK